MYIVVKEEHLEFILLSLQTHSITDLENLNIFHWLSKTRLGNWLELKILLRIFSLKQIYPRNNNLMKSSMIALLHSKYLVSVCSLNSTVQTDFFYQILFTIFILFIFYFSPKITVRWHWFTSTYWSRRTLSSRFASICHGGKAGYKFFPFIYFHFQYHKWACTSLNTIKKSYYLIRWEIIIQWL